MICAVITPVGPGHGALFDQVCAASVKQAEAWDRGPFSEIRHYRIDDAEGLYGRSESRNAALRRAKEEGVDWVFFLDADDMMTPNAFAAFGKVIAEEPGLQAVWGLICTQGLGGEPELREGQPERLDDLEAFLATPPHEAVQIGGFIRTEIAAGIGFDGAMDCGEDYKFYCQLWAEACCAKRPEIFFVNCRGQHSTGPRSATGAEWSHQVLDLWKAQLARARVRVSFDDGRAEPVRMRLTNPADLIQAAYLEGRYFEADSLEKLRRLCKVESPHVVEVGANIGNHVVWYARQLGAERIYPVEPNPAALELLEDNIAANGIADRIDRRGMGLGAGADEGRFAAMTPDDDNLGATQLVADADGGIETRTLDSLMGKARVDVLKIDAEGMELEVLAGARELIARERPVIWVEVLRANMMGFVQGWCRSAGYRLADSTTYRNTMDYFVVPKDRS